VRLGIDTVCANVKKSGKRSAPVLLSAARKAKGPKHAKHPRGGRENAGALAGKRHRAGRDITHAMGDDTDNPEEGRERRSNEDEEEATGPSLLPIIGDSGLPGTMLEGGTESCEGTSIKAHWRWGPCLWRVFCGALWKGKLGAPAVCSGTVWLGGKPAADVAGVTDWRETGGLSCFECTPRGCVRTRLFTKNGPAETR